MSIRSAPLALCASCKGRAIRLVGAVAAFVVLIVIAPIPLAQQWDARFTAAVERPHPILDRPASALVLLANAEIIIPAVALAGSLWLLPDRRAGIAALWLVAGLTVGSLIVLVLQQVIVHPGPAARLPPTWLEVGFHRALQTGYQTPPSPYSFPSGHTVRTTLIALTALRRFPWAAGALVAGMMAALVYRGDHSVSDVLGGLCLGWVIVETAALIGIVADV